MPILRFPRAPPSYSLHGDSSPLSLGVGAPYSLGSDFHGLRSPLSETMPDEHDTINLISIICSAREMFNSMRGLIGSPSLNPFEARDRLSFTSFNMGG